MTSQAVKLTTDKLVHRIRERCEDREDGFKFFVAYFYYKQKGAPFIFNWHHDKLITELMDVWNGRTTFLNINIPPRYSKTELVVIMFSAWSYMMNPKCEFIHLSYSGALVLENSERIRAILKSSEFHELWGDMNINPHKDSKGVWGTSAGGSFLATASGGGITGFGAGRFDEVSKAGEYTFSGAILIDDPLKPDDANSDVKREFVNGRWDSTVKSRRNSPRTPVIVIMQRIHEKDFVGMLQKDSEFDWRNLILPALIDEGLPTETALWESKHSVADLKAMKAKNSYHYSAQYQQNPKPLGGGLIKGAWFKRHSIVPKLKYRVIYADTAQKTKERHDYSVFECWGLGEDGGIFLMDLKRGKWEAPELKSTAIDFWNKHKAGTNGALRVMKVEDKASGTGLIQDIKKGGKIPIKGIPRAVDKLTRVMDIVSFIESGYVSIPEEAEWVSDFIHECEAFTKDDTHANDDQIDPMCDAINDMLAKPTKGFFS